MNATLYRDVLFNVLFAFFVLTVLMLPNLNPPAEKAKAEPPGNIIVHITWPPGNTDVDLWVDGPGELVPVGYSNQGGILWNLLRDDLGTVPDATGINYENAYSRGVVPGDYTINVHCYRCRQLPVPVDIELSLAPDAGGSTKMRAEVVATSRVELRAAGQERTALRFRIDPDGGVDPASFSTVFKPLRDMKGKGS
jgi:hypothetical protein